MDWETTKYVFWIVLPVLGLIGFVNAIFSLKDRWKKWRPIRSKKSFDRRIADLKMKFQIIERKRSSSLIVPEIIHEAMPLVMLLVLSACFFIISFSSNLISDGKDTGLKWIALISSYLAQAAIINAVLKLIKFISFLRRVNYPWIIAEEIIKLTNKGKSKGFLDANGNELINRVIKSKLFTEKYQKELATMAGIDYVNELPTNPKIQ